MTFAKYQPFCRKNNVDIGVYNLNKGRILPETVKERNICLHSQKNHFCVICKLNRKTSFSKSVDEIVMYLLLISKFVTLNFCNTVNHMQLVFIIFFLLYECFNGDLNEKELPIEKHKVHVFDREKGNPVIKMID